MSSLDQYKREQEQLQMFLGEVGDELGRQVGFVQRQSGFGGNGLVQTLCLGCLENGKSSLQALSQVAADLGIAISASGIHQRLTMEAVEVLEQVCQIWMSQKAEGRGKAVLEAFRAVHIVDSSEIELHPSLAAHFRGTRRAASLKMQLAYEYRHSKLEALELQAGCEPDQNSDLALDVSYAGELVVYDLGYFKQERFAELEARGIYFVSRLQGQVGLYEEASSLVKLDLLRSLPRNCPVGEMPVYLGRKSKVPVRLIFLRLPSDVVAERRRKAKQAAKKERKTCSQAQLDWLEWAFFITNAPEVWLNVEQVALLYRVRWQIELIFKLWKSEMDFGFMGKWRVERILAQFYGRLLALLMFHGFLEKYQREDAWESSLPQAYAVFKRRANQLMQLVARSFWGIRRFLRQLDDDFRRFAPKTKRRKNLSTLDHLKKMGA